MLFKEVFLAIICSQCIDSKTTLFFTNTLNVLMACHKLLIFVSRNIPKQFSAKVANKSDKMVAAIRCWYFN
jgi:hypothetical protein